MPTLVFTYSVKQGILFDEFKKFLEQVDQPVTLALPSVISSRILRVQGDEMPFQCIEVLEITSFEAWQRDSQLPEVKQVIDQWPEYGEMASVKAYSCVEFFAGEAAKQP